jgi:hypothetical protein
MLGIAVGAPVGKFVMCNSKNDSTFFITSMNVFVAFDVECMVKETYGHALIPFCFWVLSP